MLKKYTKNYKNIVLCIIGTWFKILFDRGMKNMLATLIPLFDETMTVKAYSLFAQKENRLLNPSYLGAGITAGIHVAGFDLIESMGIETIPDDKEIFVPVTNREGETDSGITVMCSEGSGDGSGGKVHVTLNMKTQV